MSLHDELVAMERAFWGAGGDAAFYREHFADDGRCVFSVGILDKDAVMTAIDSGVPWTDLHLDEVSVIPVGDEVAAITYRARAVPEGGGTDPYDVYISSVYVRRDDRWQLLLHQHVPPAG